MPYLDTYSGAWTSKEATHLLKRTTFGVTSQLISEATTLGMSASIDKLFEVLPMPSPPVKYYPDEPDTKFDDPDAMYGETWVNGIPYPSTSISGITKFDMLQNRRKSLYAWSILQMLNEGFSIREKLTLFLHNHFVAKSGNAIIEYDYITTLRENAFGNFRELTKKITLNTGMLIYLNGNQNTNQSPNENYARELLELFTIGKGPDQGGGDYTNYTEDDIVEIAKILTGWGTKDFNTREALVPSFNNDKHSTGSKQLSHRFNNAIIEENGEFEYSDLIDVVFQQDECSRFISRQLYIWFVNPIISSDLEVNVIEPLSQIIRDNNYEIVPALKVLFASDHFYQSAACMIKSPIDLFLSIAKSCLVKLPDSIQEKYTYANTIKVIAGIVDQSLFNHPNVAGWPAYYQAPLYDKLWINSTFLPQRHLYSSKIINGDNIFYYNYKKYALPPLPVLDLAATIPNAEDPNLLIQGLADLMYNYNISENQKISLKEFLLGNLPDYEWNTEYSQYLADPTDEGMKVSIESKLKSLLTAMVKMTEFQIM